MQQNREDELEYDSFEEFEAYLTNHHVDKSDGYDGDDEPDEEEDTDEEIVDA